MKLQDALIDFGVTGDLLTAGEKNFLDEQGYLPLPGILPQEQIEKMRKRLALLAELEQESAGKEVHLETGTLRLANLVDKGDMFHVCFTHPRVLAAISHVLQGDFKLSSLNSRAALPGQGKQALHADWGSVVEPPDYQVCNSIWLLDDFTPENGATRAVPGTHRSGKLPGKAMVNPMDDHPDQMLFLAPAGTVFIFNSHTWHGGTLNRTAAPRRAVHSYFTRRSQPQQTPQRRFLSPATIEGLSPAARYILDVG